MSTLITTYDYKSPFCLEAMSLDMPLMTERHVNRAPFRGVLTRLDEPSTRPPHGSQGHRVLLPSDVADAALPSLIGMAINYAPTGKDHAPRIKIGIITGGEIRGRDLWIEGHLFEKDFAREVADIRAKQSRLGCSFEISNVAIDDPRADVWVIRQLQFTGAAILEKTSAAYEQTAIAAHAATGRTRRKEYVMAQSLLERLEALRQQVEVMAQGLDEEPEVVEAAEDPDDAPDMDEKDEEEGPRSKGKKKMKAAEDDHTEVVAAIEQLTEVVEGLQQSLQAAKGKDKPRPSTRKPKGHNMHATAWEHLVSALQASEDEDVDLAEVIDAVRRQKLQASATKAQEKRLAKIEAAMELLTDSVSTMKGLLTDVQSSVGKLCTDKPVTDPQGGEATVPQRKTMAGQGTPKWLDKYDGTNGAQYDANQVTAILDQIGILDPMVRQTFTTDLAASTEGTPPNLDALLTKAGVTDPTQRMAVKLQLQSMAHN